MGGGAIDNAITKAKPMITAAITIAIASGTIGTTRVISLR
jgi:hypothetical protein